jgi:hypothetical protein
VLFLIPTTLVCAPREVRYLAEEARRFPPEFAAEALLRLAGAANQSAEWRREQMGDVFRLAVPASRRIRSTGRSAL